MSSIACSSAIFSLPWLICHHSALELGRNRPCRGIMPEYFPPRPRKVRILATLGPASRSPEMIRALHLAGADALRVNMSNGKQADRAEGIAAIRALEKEDGRELTDLDDLQGLALAQGTVKTTEDVRVGNEEDRKWG